MRIDIKQAQRRDGDILPLINIVFLLLIFFLLTSTIAPKPDIDVTPPDTQDGEPASPPADAIYLSAEGFVSVDGNEATFEELPRVLRPFLASLGDKPVRIVADRGSEGTDLLQIVDAIRAAGGSTIRLVTMRDSAP